MNPEVFRWARETAGLSQEQAAKALEIKGVERLQDFEAGKVVPSRSVLLRMAKKYRRPLVAFYMSKPPMRGDRGEDFRTLPPDRAVADDALLDALLRDVKARQALVRSVVEDDEDAARLPFVGSCLMAQGGERVQRTIVQALAFDLLTFRAARTADDGFAYLRGQAEAAGIFVLLMSNLGSHHSSMSVRTFRGFAIADEYAPFIVINDQDARTAWNFTLLHELAHLCLGQSGVSGPIGEENPKDIEQFCNSVAASILLPAAELNELDVNNNTPLDAAMTAVTAFARPRHISRQMAAYALYRARRISRQRWAELNGEFEQAWGRERAAEKASNADNAISYYVVRRHRLGSALVSFVGRSLAAGTISPVKGARVLGVKPRSLYALLNPQRNAKRAA
jgi:Zn-dependent peptidase ImmA (M78 family)/transcriptional regulator with XRE-family HTH domain